jgi:hypothetical protein
MPRLLPQERARLDRAVATLWRYRHRLSGGQEASVRALAESLATGPDHGQVLVVRPGWGPVSVDWGIAPLLRACWAVGVGTEFSCQEGLRGMAYIAFTSRPDMAGFRVAVGGLADVGWWEWEDDAGMLPCVRFPAPKMAVVTEVVQRAALAATGGVPS